MLRVLRVILRDGGLHTEEKHYRQIKGLGTVNLQKNAEDKLSGSRRK